MNLGSRIGSALGRFASRDTIDATRDALSGIFMPADAGEWAELGLTAPDSLYIPEGVASGDLPDLIGGLTFAKTGTWSYNQSVTGWSSRGVKGREGQAGDYFAVNDSNPSLVSTLYLLYLAPGTAGSTRNIVDIGSSTEESLNINAANKFVVKSGVNTAISSAAFTPGTGTATVLKHDRSISKLKGYTLDEILIPTYSAPGSSVDHYIGAGFAECSDSTYLYIARWKGVAAEMSDATIRIMLRTLGHTVTW